MLQLELCGEIDSAIIIVWHQKHLELWSCWPLQPWWFICQKLWAIIIVWHQKVALRMSLFSNTEKPRPFFYSFYVPASCIWNVEFRKISWVLVLGSWMGSLGLIKENSTFKYILANEINFSPFLHRWHLRDWHRWMCIKSLPTWRWVYTGYCHLYMQL